jgi:hypothetical protein
MRDLIGSVFFFFYNNILWLKETNTFETYLYLIYLFYL